LARLSETSRLANALCGRFEQPVGVKNRRKSTPELDRRLQALQSTAELSNQLDQKSSMELYGAVRYSLIRISDELFSAGSILSIYSLATTFFIAVCALAYRHERRRGRANLKAIFRAIFTTNIARHKSFYADVKLFALSVVVMPVIMGALVISTNTVSIAVHSVLRSAFGPIDSFDGHDVLIKVVSTLVLFLAYEIGYWVDHYLKHRIPFLWEFHKLHHTAEVLSPLTNFRNHPIDNLVFGYMLSLFIGGASGVLAWLFSRNTEMFSIDGKNIIFIVFLWTIGHLQHSQFWIPFCGIWGRIIMSPAHHQIHHSNDPKHFNRNLGSVLAVWDWMCGTLEIPSIRDPRLSYGVKEESQDAHSSVGILVTPVIRASLTLWPALLSMKKSFSSAWNSLTDRTRQRRHGAKRNAI
jgi:sterol desaturase/sphingolipid hydroxylase (fatty acid hydroxylase superfamily)